MRIGCVIYQLKNAGGVIQLLNLAQELQLKGHTITIYTLTNKIVDVDPQLLQGLKIKSCNISSQVEKKPHNQLVGFLLYIWFHLKATYLLSSLIYPDELDILNPHEWPAHWTTVIIKWLRKTPVVWVCNDVWHIPGNEESKENRILFSLGNKFIVGLVDRLLTSFVDSTLVLDHRVEKIINNYYHKTSTVIRTGINIDDFKKIIPKNVARKHLGLSKSPFIFLCLHAFFRHRRFEDVVSATEKIKARNPNKEYKVFIVGSGRFHPSYVTFIRDLIKKKNLEQTITLKTEYISTELVRKFFFASDGFIFPNENQTWGIAAIEAMAAGKPCIISTGAGVHEIIKDGETGLLFKVRDSAMLSEKMEFLLENTKSAQKIGEKARQYVFTHYSWQKFANTVEDIFKEKLSRK